MDRPWPPTPPSALLHDLVGGYSLTHSTHIPRSKVEMEKEGVLETPLRISSWFLLARMSVSGYYQQQGMLGNVLPVVTLWPIKSQNSIISEEIINR